MQLLTARARAYVYAGDWVADCPVGCSNVEFLFDRLNPQDPRSPRAVRKTQWYCSYCHHIAEIEWPPDGDELMAVLSRRPIPHTRNWYPADHDMAVRSNTPHGQSVADLLAENADHGVM